MPIKAELLNILVCPSCRGPLWYRSDKPDLVCRGERLAYPIREDIPVMLVAEASAVSAEELE